MDWLSTFWLIAGVIFLVIALISVIRVRQQSKFCTETVNATISDIILEQSDDSGNYVYHLVYSFKYNGYDYTIKDSVGWSHTPKGKLIGSPANLQVDPQDVVNNWYDTDLKTSVWLVPFIFAILGVVYLTIGVFV